MTILVTGANGHVGGNLVRELLGRGERVRAMVHQSARALEGLDVERVAGDVTDAATLAPALEGVDLVFHLAARISIDGPHGGLVDRINVEGARNVAEAALGAGVRRFVHCSSVHAYDQAPLGEPLDERRAKVSGAGHPAYDLSKAAGEAAVRRVVARGLDAVVVNPTGIIGPFDFGPSRMGQVFIQLQRRRLGALVNGGFDWVDVRDVAAGLIAAAERGRTGENYLLAGHRLSVREVAALSASTTGVAPPRFDVPMSLARAAAPFALGFSRLARRPPLFTPESLLALRGNPVVSSDKARAELGYRPRPIAETVADIYRWFGEAGMLARDGGDRSIA